MMDTLKSAFNDYPYLSGCIATGTVIATSILIFKFLLRSQAKKDLLKGPPDTVILFQFTRGPFAPSLSPFPMKLETYLRMGKIPYENNFKRIMSSKGKTPWIAYNGEAVADSQLCIEYLNAKRGLDLNKHLTAEQRAVAKCIQIMMDEHFYWTLAYYRWVHDDKAKVLLQVPQMSKFLVYTFRHFVKKQLWGQGLGRHSQEEIHRFMMADLTALSDYLGNKSFIMGEEPCETDCSIFGMLAQPMWQQQDDVLGNLLQEKFPNLERYCLRMKERFWPDWEECLGKKKK